MSASHSTGIARGGWPQVLALVVGAVYLLIGIIGYFMTGFSNFFTYESGERLLVFEINGMHNLVHLVIGIAGLLLARTLAGARTYGWVLAIVYGAAFVYGLFAVNAEWDFLSLNWADNWLHLITALVGLAIALAPARTAARTRT